MTNLINICLFWEYCCFKWRQWSCVHRIICWILEIGLKLVEKDGKGFLLPQHWCSVKKHPKFTKLTHPDAFVDQYMFVLIISTFNLTALILCISNTMLEGSRPTLVAKDCLYPTSLMIIPQAPTFYTHPNDQFDRYMFVLIISPLTMMALISCTSNTSYAR